MPIRQSRWFSTFAGIAILLLSVPSARAETLTVWAMGEEGLRIAAMARKFEAETPGVKVITQAIPWDAAHEKLLTVVVGGLPPDVSQMGTTWMAEFATLQAFEPLDDYVRQSGIVKQDKFFSGSWQTGVVKGRLYGIPWYVDTRVLFYRKDLLAQAGIPHPPRTWNELKAACKVLRKDSDRNGKADSYGITLPVRDWGVFLSFVWQNGGDVFRPASPEYIEAMKYYASFFREDLAPSGRAADIDLFQAFKTGFYAMFISGPWMVELIDRELPELKGKWGAALMPKKKHGTSFVGGSNLVVFKDSKKKELAWKFVEFMSRTDNQIEWHRMLNSLPAVKDAWNAPALAKHEMLRVFGDQMEDVQSPPNVPEWEQIASLINTRMESVILSPRGEGDKIEQVMREHQREVEDAVKERETSGVRVDQFLYTALAMACGVAFLYFYISHRVSTVDAKSNRRTLPRNERASSFFNTLRRAYPGYLFILPSVMVLTLFLFIPILASFLISLTDWNIYSLADRGRLNFVGFKNYMDVVHDQVFWKSLWNTLFFTAVGVPFTIMISLLCAVVLNEKFVRWKTFFRTAFFLPVISTIVAVAVVWRWIYNPEYGLLNWFMKSVGLPEFNWLSDPSTALASLILMAAWKNFGYNMVIFLAGLQSIPEALYESARIDGANVWQLFLHVTLPGLRTTTVFVAVMSTIGYLQFFAEPYVMTNKGGPLNSTMSIVLYMYNQGFKFFQLGYASALAYILFGIIFAFTFLQIRLRKSGFETPV